MNKRTLWLVVTLLGLVPFLLPFVTGLYHMYIESWTMLDWLIMYSFIYWPTYVIGLAAIVMGLYHYFRRT